MRAEGVTIDLARVSRFRYAENIKLAAQRQAQRPTKTLDCRDTQLRRRLKLLRARVREHFERRK